MINRDNKLARLDIAEKNSARARYLLMTSQDRMKVLDNLLNHIIDSIEETQQVLRELINDQS